MLGYADLVSRPRIEIYMIWEPLIRNERGMTSKILEQLQHK